MEEIVKYQRKHFRFREEGEIIGEPRTATRCFVDVKGYIPLRNQIERLMASGERLEAYRKAVYDFSRGMVGNYEEDFEPDVTQDPDFMPSVDMPIASAEYEAKLKALELQKQAQLDESGASVGNSEPTKEGVEPSEG